MDEVTYELIELDASGNPGRSVATIEARRGVGKVAVEFDPGSGRRLAIAAVSMENGRRVARPILTLA